MVYSGSLETWKIDFPVSSASSLTCFALLSFLLEESCLNDTLNTFINPKTFYSNPFNQAVYQFLCSSVGVKFEHFRMLISGAWYQLIPQIWSMVSAPTFRNSGLYS